MSRTIFLVSEVVTQDDCQNTRYQVLYTEGWGGEGCA